MNRVLVLCRSMWQVRIELTPYDYETYALPTALLPLLLICSVSKCLSRAASNPMYCQDTQLACSTNLLSPVGSKKLARGHHMHLPGVVPEAQAWKACMLPLHYRC
jgi:hypothetical protein